MHETLFASTEGRLLGVGLALTALMLLAFGMWGLLLNELSTWAATVNQLAPFALVVAIALIALAIHLLGRRRDHR